MHIHIHNPAAAPPDPITQAEWDGAVARAGAVAQGHQVTFSHDEAGFLAALPTMQALVTSTGLAKKHFPADAPNLRMVFVTSAGLDRLAPFDMFPPGVALVNNSGTHSAKAGEFAIMALLMLANRIPAFVTDGRNGRWDHQLTPMLSGRAVTIIGLGGLGGAAATQARNFGMTVTGVRTKAAPHPACHRVIGIDALEAELATTGLLVLACPLTDATRNILSRERIALMPRGAGVVNIGRGALIDQDALLDGLDSGHLGGAVLDVTTPEPVPAGHRLWSTPNLIVTPHMSCDDPNTYNPVSLDIFFANLDAMLAGKLLPNQIDVTKGY